MKTISYDVMQRITGCTYKTKFSHEQAKEKAQEYGIYYYKCNICGSYHLTKQQTYESIMEDS